jgi:hypothetical protein
LLQLLFSHILNSKSIEDALRGDSITTGDFQTIMRLVDSRLSLPLVYSACRDVLRSRMPAENMYIGLRAKEGLRFPYFLDERMPENPLEIFPKEGWTGYILDTGKRYCLSLDAPPPETAKPVGALPQDWLGVPILDRDRSPMGVLTVQTYRAHESYTASDVEFLEFTAEALSVAIQLADQDREIAIHRIAALVEETVDVTDLYPKIHEILQTIIPAARKNLIISRVDESAGVFIPVFWRDEKDELATSPWPLSHGMSGYIPRMPRSSTRMASPRSPPVLSTSAAFPNTGWEHRFSTGTRSSASW